MSCSHAAASSRSASAPRTGTRLRARAAAPWTWAQRRGRGSWRSARASCSAHETSVFMRPRLGSCGGTFTDAACRSKTSCSASRPIIRHCWPERGRLCWHQGSCGVRRYRRDSDGDHRRGSWPADLTRTSMERMLPGFLTRCWTGCQDRQPAANPYRATRARAVVRLNLAFPLAVQALPRPRPRPCRIGLTLLSAVRFLAPAPWRASHRRGVTGSVRGITLRVRTTRQVEHR